MGNLCFSGKNDGVGDLKKQIPGQEPSVEAKPITKKLLVQKNPVQENPKQENLVLGLASLHLPELAFSFFLILNDCNRERCGERRTLIIWMRPIRSFEYIRRADMQNMFSW